MNVSKLMVNGQEYNFTDSDAQSKIENLDGNTYSKGEVDNKIAECAKTSEVTSELAKKVDSVNGKQLSTEDYTTTDKNKLAGIESGANNYSLPTASKTTKGGVKVGDGISIEGDTISADKQIDWKTIE